MPSFTVNCVPNGNGVFGLYVDGSPISGSARSFTDAVATNYDAAAVTDLLTAGSHTISMLPNCTNGNGGSSFATSTNRQFSAILLGG
jgi:hypothetical protein